MRVRARRFAGRRLIIAGSTSAPREYPTYNTRCFFQLARYVSRIDCKSREAESGMRFVQKYCNALRPTTGIPLRASTREIDLSMLAHPPSPETNTTSVSDAPFVAGTSIKGSFLVAVATARRSEQSIGPAITTSFLWDLFDHHGGDGGNEDISVPSVVNHFATTPRNPPEISVARFVRILGSAKPPGEARYIGSHSGSNFSLYCLRPWKL